jgi:hypothetical protein
MPPVRLEPTMVIFQRSKTVLPSWSASLVILRYNRDRPIHNNYLYIICLLQTVYLAFKCRKQSPVTLTTCQKKNSVVGRCSHPWHVGQNSVTSSHTFPLRKYGARWGRVSSLKANDKTKIWLVYVHFKRPYNEKTILLMIMSMGWDYVSKLRLLTGTFLIPQVIYEHG